MKIVVSGGAGFIGSNFVRYLLDQTDDHVVILDKLTHAGNMENLVQACDHERYSFIQGDIADLETVRRAIDGAEIVINFAAESHVDRSILDPEPFLRTNVQGTFAMLEACRRDGVGRYLQVSTDEVYGEILEGSTPETAVIQPRSPYAATKAAGDLLVS
ncbi:MAG TPA: GDP-mannose 4,6-dehydratase, partial [Chloroflexota bacterium]